MTTLRSKTTTTTRGLTTLPATRGTTRVATVATTGNLDLGAGVLLIETYNRRTPVKSGLAVILFRDAKSQLYAEGGGHIDKGETEKQCAQRELKEESFGLFRIDLGVVPIVKTVLSNQGRYTCFVVYVKGPAHVGIRRDAYKHNLKTLMDHKRVGWDVPREWLETDDMTRVYLEEFARSPPRADGCVDVSDVYGDSIVVHHRTANVVKKSDGAHRNLTCHPHGRRAEQRQ